MNAAYRRRLIFFTSTALVVGMAPAAHAETICSQAPDGTVECVEGGTTTASGTMSPGAVEPGAGLQAFVYGEYLRGNIVGNISVEGDGQTALRLSADDGAVAYTQLGDISATGAGSRGVRAYGTNGVDLQVGNVVSNGEGVWIGAELGGISAVIGDVTTLGNNAAALSLLTGRSAYLTCGNLRTSGANSHGLVLWSDEFPITADCGNILTEGDGSFGAKLDVKGSDIGIGNVVTSGDGAIGVNMVRDYYPGSLTVGDVTTSGNNATAVLVRSEAFDPANGQEVVTVGNVSTSGATAVGIAIDAQAEIVLQSGDVTTLGAQSAGIVASSDRGIQLSAGRVSTSGNQSNGLVLSGTDIDVTVASATASGTASDAMQLTGGDVSVAAAGDVTSADGTAVVVGATGAFSFDLAEGATLAGRTGGIRSDAGSTTVNISGSVLASQGPSLRLFGGPATVNVAASGSIVGTMQFGTGDDSLTNLGLVGISGSSDFGAGNDLFANNALFRVDGTVGLAGLERFNNAGGTIDMRDGGTGDSLTISGDFAGGAGLRFFWTSADRSTAPTRLSWAAPCRGSPSSI